jgi:hypothetical protein
MLSETNLRLSLQGRGLGKDFPGRREARGDGELPPQSEAPNPPPHNKHGPSIARPWPAWPWPAMAGPRSGRGPAMARQILAMARPLPDRGSAMARSCPRPWPYIWTSCRCRNRILYYKSISSQSQRRKPLKLEPPVRDLLPGAAPTNLIRFRTVTGGCAAVLLRRSVTTATVGTTRPTNELCHVCCGFHGTSPYVGLVFKAWVTVLNRRGLVVWRNVMTRGRRHG